MTSVGDYFSWVDWLVLGLYLVLTTMMGHFMSGKSSTIKDFFLGGRSLPWPAVSGSIIATEISGVSFIGVPGMLFALNGDFTYMQWAIGSIFARIVVAYYFIPVFFEREIYSPYDFMGQRLGKSIKTLATVMFTAGGILGQSVRVLVAAMPLKIVTGLDTTYCILIIGAVAITWTLMGGMQTVIWTDVMQFVLFVLGGLISIFVLIGNIDGGFGAFWTAASEAKKTNFFDWTFGFGKELQFTFWVAILAVPFQNLTAFGVDQLNAQRMFCCKDVSSARKALIFSSFGQVLTLLMMMVGAALFVFYLQNGFSPEEAKAVGVEGNGLIDGTLAEPSARDMVFPAWIVKNLPAGISGLILAGVFAASISSLDSILAALSQTTLSLVYHPEDHKEGQAPQNHKKLLSMSRLLVCVWGVLLTGFTILLFNSKDKIEIVPLAFGMTAYSVGPLLGIFLCALIGRVRPVGLFIGVSISVLLAVFVRTDIWQLFGSVFDTNFAFLDALPTLQFRDGSLSPVFSYVWLWPVSTIITVVCGLLFRRKASL